MPKILRNQPIRTWEAGDSVQGFALLTKKEMRQDRNAKSFLDMEIADASAGGRVVSVLEGGYDLEGLAKSAAAHVAALMQG